MLLTPTRAAADHYNRAGLAALPGEQTLYRCRIEGKFDIARDRLPAPEVLVLKPGAEVIRCYPRLWAVVAKNKLTGRLVARRDLKSKLPSVPHIIVDNKESAGVISSRSDHTRDECNGSDRIAV